jgi:putative inorganic carbon (hco3(-)) transporter
MSVLTQKRLANHLTDIEIVPVVLAIGLSLVWPKLLWAAVITAAFFWVMRRVSDGHFTIRTPGDVGIIILIVMVPITLWATAQPDKTQVQVLRLLSGIALYYAIVNWCKSVKRLRMMLIAFAALGLGLALIAPISVEWAIDKLPLVPASLYQKFPPLFSDTVHPNVLAGSLVILIPIILAEIIFAWGNLTRFERGLNSVALIVMLVVLGLSLSRGAWIALGIALIVMAILRWRRGWIGLVLSVIMAAIFIRWLGLSAVVQALDSSGTIGGLDGRLEIWSRAIYMIQDFPFTGIGMGSFGEVADTLYPLLLYPPDSIAHAHNLFLQIAVDLGIPGLIGWLVVLGSVVVASWKLYIYGRRNKEQLATGLGAGLLCSQIALVVHGMTDAVTWGMVRPAPIVWAIWGLAIACWFVFVINQITNTQVKNS